MDCPSRGYKCAVISRKIPGGRIPVNTGEKRTNSARIEQFRTPGHEGDAELLSSTQVCRHDCSLSCPAANPRWKPCIELIGPALHGHAMRHVVNAAVFQKERTSAKFLEIMGTMVGPVKRQEGLT